MQFYSYQPTRDLVVKDALPPSVRTLATMGRSVKCRRFLLQMDPEHYHATVVLHQMNQEDEEAHGQTSQDRQRHRAAYRPVG